MAYEDSGRATCAHIVRESAGCGECRPTPAPAFEPDRAAAYA